jgi:hypothetical protein
MDPKYYVLPNILVPTLSIYFLGGNKEKTTPLNHLARMHYEITPHYQILPAPLPLWLPPPPLLPLPPRLPLLLLSPPLTYPHYLARLCRQIPRRRYRPLDNTQLLMNANKPSGYIPHAYLGYIPHACVDNILCNKLQLILINSFADLDLGDH